MKEGSYSQRFDFGNFTKGGKRSQRTEQSPPFQKQFHSKEKQEAHRERAYHSRAGMTPDEQVEQRRKKQAEENKYREMNGIKLRIALYVSIGYWEQYRPHKKGFC